MNRRMQERNRRIQRRRLRYRRLRQLRALMLFLACFAYANLSAPTSQAQSSPVSPDAVNAIASELYCPVCENIPLDVCGTAACDDWRNEISIMLGQGLSAEQIKADFVSRFGDRVVGTPQDPTLRALSLVTPWVAAALALGLVAYTVLRWQRGTQQHRLDAALDTQAVSPTSGDSLRARLEQDVQGS